MSKAEARPTASRFMVDRLRCSVRKWPLDIERLPRLLLRREFDRCRLDIGVFSLEMTGPLGFFLVLRSSPIAGRLPGQDGIRINDGKTAMGGGPDGSRAGNSTRGAGPLGYRAFQRVARAFQYMENSG